MKRAQLPARPIKCDIAKVQHKKTVCVLNLKVWPDDIASMYAKDLPIVAQLSMKKKTWAEFCIGELIKLGVLKPKGDDDVRDSDAVGV